MKLRLLCVFAFLMARLSAADAAPGLLFAYFVDNGQDGLHLASSEDGYRWEALNGGRSLLKPAVGREKLMRDPCIVRGPDGVFHMVWTASWKDRVIGYASSRDLITWSEQTAIPVMQHEPGAKNCWAPEIVYDEKRGHFLIFWATTIAGRFPETEFGGKNEQNHRIYCTTTADFKTFSPTRLFFDPGFNVIDSTLVRRGGGWVMLFKDETKFPTRKKNIRLAVADDVEGPYRVLPESLTPEGADVEGPTALTVGGDTLVLFDAYTRHRFEARRTRDWQTWEDITSAISLPAGMRHGTVFSASAEILAGLRTLSPASVYQP